MWQRKKKRKKIWKVRDEITKAVDCPFLLSPTSQLPYEEFHEEAEDTRGWGWVCQYPLMIRGVWPLEFCLDSFSVKPQNENTAPSQHDFGLPSWDRDMQINYAYVVRLYPLHGSILFQREIYKTVRVQEVDWGYIWKYGWIFTYMTWMTQSQLFHQNAHTSIPGAPREVGSCVGGKTSSL